MHLYILKEPAPVAVTVLSQVDFSLSSEAEYEFIQPYAPLSFQNLIVLFVCPKENLFTIEAFGESGIIDLPGWRFLFFSGFLLGGWGGAEWGRLWLSHRN